MVSKYKQSDMESKSDFDKEIDGKVDIVKEDEMKKEADLYDFKLNTVAPSDHDPTLGIFPKDQQLSDHHVILWNSVRTIPTSIIDSGYKVYEVQLNKDFVKNQLKTAGSGVYWTSYVPADTPMREVSDTSYEE